MDITAPNDARDVLREAADKASKLVDDAALRATSLLGNAASISVDLGYIKRDISEIKETLKQDYVTMDKFLPIQRFVYSIIGILGVATLGALFRLIFK